jgi:signal transduction histidine kinase
VREVRAGEGRSVGADGPEGPIEQPQDAVGELRRSRTRLLLAADADRRSIERALHSGLQQLLVALAVELRQAAELVDEDPTAAKASLDEVSALLREAIDEAAKLAQSIHPPRLSEMRGLASAVRAAGERLGVAVTIEVTTAPIDAPGAIAGVYWCCAEALSLAPAGSEATVDVADADGGIRFEVVVAGSYDDGRSLRLRDRVEALGGWLSVEDMVDGRSRLVGLVPSP